MSFRLPAATSAPSHQPSSAPIRCHLRHCWRQPSEDPAGSHPKPKAHPCWGMTNFGGGLLLQIEQGQGAPTRRDSPGGRT
jgi:hypothetical protein